MGIGLESNGHGSGIQWAWDLRPMPIGFPGDGHGSNIGLEGGEKPPPPQRGRGSSFRDGGKEALYD